MSGLGFLLVIVAFVFLYFVLVRPQKKRQVQQQRMIDDLRVGDEIVTAGGLFGEIREVREAELLVRVAPNLELRIARRAVAGVVTPEPDELEAGADDEENGSTAQA